MIKFIRLHLYSKKEEDQEEILVNPANISYITPTIDDEGSYVYFCCAASKEHQYQMIYVKESIHEIERLIKMV